MLMGIATVTIIMVTAGFYSPSRGFPGGVVFGPGPRGPFGLAAVLFYASERI